MATIVLVPLPGSAEADLPRLADLLGEVFLAPVAVEQAWRTMRFAFDTSRGQYSSRAVLAALLRREGAAGERILGVTGLDLFMPVLTFVFGEAQLRGQAAVVSTCRLAPTFYGLAADRELLQERLQKEAVHELGHTYGLLHCADTRCVMRRSTYVEELDSKDVGFCTRCLGQIAGQSGGKGRDYHHTS
jgi:archaemetzincin